jgi:hypothetical protein
MQPANVCVPHNLSDFTPRVKVTWKASDKSNRVCGP